MGGRWQAGREGSCRAEMCAVAEAGPGWPGAGLSVLAFQVIARDSDLSPAAPDCISRKLELESRVCIWLMPVYQGAFELLAKYLKSSCGLLMDALLRDNMDFPSILMNFPIH